MSHTFASNMAIVSIDQFFNYNLIKENNHRERY